MSKESKLIELKKVVQLKIALKHTKPLIWRRVLVRNSISFFELHHTIQLAMGWENYHLYEFRVNNYRIGEPEEDFGDNSKVIDAKKITLEEALSSEIETFSYEYDFGDSWRHEITVEKIIPLDNKIDYPTCLDGKMNCPPEDCGGVSGYYHLLEILADKNNPERNEMIEWLGEVYNPTYFNLEQINYNLEFVSQNMEGEDEIWNEEAFGDDFLRDDEEDIFGDDADLWDIFGALSIKVVNKSKHPLPHYETEASAGMDLRANLEKSVQLKPLERALIKTGLFMELPLECEAQVRPRSGLALKHGITVLNAPGTIDADYRGEIGVILVNLSSETYVIEDGERIAQLVIAHLARADWEEVDKLGDTDRGEGGFGSTGR